MFLHRAAVFFQQRFQVPQDGLPGLSRGLQKLFGRAVVIIRDLVNNFPGQRLQLRPFLDADGSQTLHFPHGPRRNVIFQDKLHGVLVRFAENGRLQEVRLHIRVNTLDALVQLPHPSKVGQNSGNQRIPGKSRVLNIFHRHDAGQFPGAQKLNAIIKHGHADIVP